MPVPVCNGYLLGSDIRTVRDALKSTAAVFHLDGSRQSEDIVVVDNCPRCGYWTEN